MVRHSQGSWRVWSHDLDLSNRADGIEGLEDLISRVAGVGSRIQPGGDPVAGIAHEGDVHQHEHHSQRRFDKRLEL